MVLAGRRHGYFGSPSIGVLHMTGFEVFWQLLADETDRQAIFAALPTIQADIDMVADDATRLANSTKAVADDTIRLARSVKILNARLAPVVEAMRKVSG